MKVTGCKASGVLTLLVAILASQVNCQSTGQIACLPGQQGVNCLSPKLTPSPSLGPVAARAATVSPALNLFATGQQTPSPFPTPSASPKASPSPSPGQDSPSPRIAQSPSPSGLSPSTSSPSPSGQSPTRQPGLSSPSPLAASLVTIATISPTASASPSSPAGVTTSITPSPAFSPLATQRGGEISSPSPAAGVNVNFSPSFTATPVVRQLPSATASPSFSPSLVATFGLSPTPSPSGFLGPTPSPSITPSPNVQRLASPTASPSLSPSVIATRVPSTSPSQSPVSFSPTVFATLITTPTPSPAVASGFGFSPSSTLSPNAQRTGAPTPSPSASPALFATIGPTPSSSPTYAGSLGSTIAAAPVPSLARTAAASPSLAAFRSPLPFATLAPSQIASSPGTVQFAPTTSTTSRGAQGPVVVEGPVPSSGISPTMRNGPVGASIAADGPSRSTTALPPQLQGLGVPAAVLAATPGTPRGAALDAGPSGMPTGSAVLRGNLAPGSQILASPGGGAASARTSGPTAAGPAGGAASGPSQQRSAGVLGPATANPDAAVKGAAPGNSAVCGTSTTRPCNASSFLAPAPGVGARVALTPGLDTTTGNFPVCTGCPANSTGLLIVNHFTTITNVGPNAESSYQQTVNQLQQRAPEVVYVLRTVYNNACPACNFERWASVETTRAIITPDIIPQVQAFAVGVANTPVGRESYGASEHFSVDEEIRVRAAAVQTLSELAATELSSSSCTNCRKLQQAVQRLASSSEEELLRLCRSPELLVRWEAVQGYINIGGIGQVTSRKQYLLNTLPQQDHWLVTTPPASLANRTADPNSPGLRYDYSVLTNSSSINPPLVTGATSSRTEVVRVTSSTTGSTGRKLLDTCYYFPGDNEASGDNLYGAIACQQQYVDYFWKNMKMRVEDWNDGMGYESPCDLAKPFARTMNAMYALLYSSQEVSTNLDDRSGSVLKWAFPYTASNLPRLVPRCGSGDPYAGNRSSFTPAGDTLELYWPLFYGETVIERAATMFHEAIHVGLKKDHNAGTNCARKASCDSNWDYYGANTYQALYLWWFSTDGARTTTPMRRYARSEAMNIISRGFGTVPDVYIPEVA